MLHNTEVKQPKKRDRLADLHIKRRVPQLYLSKCLRDGSQGKQLNEFNSVLKDSLLTPQRHRQVMTLKEQEA